MLSIHHVDALPPVGINREVNEVSGLGQDAGVFQNFKQSCTDPFGDIGPSLLANYFGYLVADGKAPEVSERIRSWSRYHSINGKPPISEGALLQSFERIGQWRHTVRERDLGNHVPRKLAGQ